MDYSEYQLQAMKTAMKLSYSSALVHGVLGVSSECGELNSTIKAHAYYGKPLDLVNMSEELGDILWFCAYLVANENLSMTEPVRDTTERHIQHEGLVLVEAQGQLLIGGVLNLGTVHLIVDTVRRLADKYCGGIDVVMHANISKLQKRYPHKYSNEAAIARADKA